MGLLNSSRKKPCKIQRVTRVVSWNRLGFRSEWLLRLLTAPRRKMILRSAKNASRPGRKLLKKTVLRWRTKAAKTRTALVRVRSVCAAPSPYIRPRQPRQAGYGGVTLNVQSCFMAAKKADSRPFTMYPDKPRCRFGKVAGIAGNAAYHRSRRVRLHLEGNGSLVKLPFLSPHSPLLNMAECFGPRARRRCAGRSGGSPRDTLCRRRCLFMSRSK